MTQNNSLEELLKTMLGIYSEREWEQYHSPKNLAMNLGVEVGEIMEHFRWLTEAQSRSPKAINEIKDEIGDVFLVLLHLAHSLGINPVQAAFEKLPKIIEKYPVDKCKGLCHKYTEYLSEV